MGKDASVTPKGTLTLASIGPGFNKDSVKCGATATLKYKRSKVNGSLAVSDGSFCNLKSLKDVVATLDFKVPKAEKVTVNTKYEAGPKKYTVGATFDGTLAKKAVTAKLTYNNKDKLVAGEATLALTKTQKVNTTFNQKNLLTAKYTYVKGDYTLEPSYNFTKQSPAVAATKKFGKKDTVKLTYDVKSEAAACEWAHKPFKVTLSSKVSTKGSVAKPTLAAVYENVFEF